MNRKSIVSMLFLALTTCPALFGMIRRTAVAPRAVSSVAPQVILPASFSQLVRSYSSPSVSTVSPIVSTFPQYDTSYQWKNQGFGAKAKWSFKDTKKVVAGALGTILVGGSIEDYLMKRAKKLQDERDEKNLETSLEISEDAKDKDPELYEVFLKIKADYGITDDIKLRIMNPFDQLNESQKALAVPRRGGRYVSLGVVLIGDYYKSLSKSALIFIIAHELEHHRQQKKMKGSYQNYQKDIHQNILHPKFKAQSAKMEIGADAAAVDYLYCSQCLREVGDNYGWTHEPQETDFGYITSPKGYFSDKDFKLYEDRAKEACAWCPAHQRWFSAFRPEASLKDYLPPIVK